MTNLTLTNEIAIFATRHSVPVSIAYTLPAIFNKAAEMIDLPVRAVINNATYFNQPLANYIKEVAQTVANQQEI